MQSKTVRILATLMAWLAVFGSHAFSEPEITHHGCASFNGTMSGAMWLAAETPKADGLEPGDVVSLVATVTSSSTEKIVFEIILKVGAVSQTRLFKVDGPGTHIFGPARVMAHASGVVAVGSISQQGTRLQTSGDVLLHYACSHPTLSDDAAPVEGDKI